MKIGALKFIDTLSEKLEKLSELIIEYDIFSSDTLEDLEKEFGVKRGDDHFKPKFAERYRQADKLKAVNIVGGLNKKDFNLFCTKLPECKEMETLNLQFNELDALDENQITDLFTAISKCKKLKTLILSGNGLGNFLNERLQAFCDGIYECKNIQKLHLTCNVLYRWNKEFFQMFCNAISKHKDMELDLRGNEFRRACWKENKNDVPFFTIFQCRSLKQLDLCNNWKECRMNAIEYEEFCSAVAESEIQILYLRENNFNVLFEDENKFKKFCKAVSDNTHLQQLYIDIIDKRPEINRIMQTRIPALCSMVSDSLFYFSLKQSVKNWQTYNKKQLEKLSDDVIKKVEKYVQVKKNVDVLHKPM